MNPPPEGLRWGDSDLGATRKRSSSSSPDVKGVFGEGASIVAVPPRPPAPRGSPEALGNLFASDKRAVGNDNEAESRKGTARKNRGLWSDEPLAQKPAAPRPSGLPAAVAGRILAASPWAGKPPTLGAPLAANRNAHDEPFGVEPAVDPARTDIAASSVRGEAASLRPRIEEPALEGDGSVELDADAESFEVEPEPIEAAPHAGPRGSAAAPAPRRAPERGSEARKRERPASAPPIAASTRLAAPRILLFACLLLIAAAAVLIGGAFAGLWTLPPTAASMLGLESPASDGGDSRRSQPAPDSALDAVAPGRAAAAAPKPEPAAPSASPPPATGDVVHPAPAATPNAAPAASERPVTPPGFEPLPAEHGAVEPAAPAPSSATLASAAKSDASTPSVNTAPQNEANANDAESAETLAQLARTKLQGGDAAGAETLLRRGLAGSPDDHHLLEPLVSALIQQGRAQEAVPYADLMVRKRPRRLVYRLLEAQAKRLAGDKNGAERAYREVLNLDPENREARRQLGITP